MHRRHSMLPGFQLGGGGGGGKFPPSPNILTLMKLFYASKLVICTILTICQVQMTSCLGFCCFQFDSSDKVGGPSIHSLRVWSRVASPNLFHSRVFVSFTSLKVLSTVAVVTGSTNLDQPPPPPKMLRTIVN